MYDISAKLLIKLIIAMIMGAIIGIERERRVKGAAFAGFRTFMLISSFGFISAFLNSQFSPYFAIISFLLTGILASLNFYRKIVEKKEKGATTEVAFLITYFIGFILYFENPPYVFSLGLTFILTLVLVLRERLHEFAHMLTVEEIRDFLIFGLVAFVIYPILPNSPIDPFGVLNLRFIWFSLALIFGLSFIVYFVFKILKKGGILFNAFLGGLINSIYVANLYSSSLKKINSINYAILVAASSMIMRVFILATLINVYNSIKLIFLFFISLLGYLIGFLFFRKTKNRKIKIELKSPLSLKFSLIYILAFTSIYFFVNLTEKFLGRTYLYFLLPIGFLDTSSLTVSFSSILFPEDLKKLLAILITFNLTGSFFVILKNSREVARNTFIPFLFLSFSLLLFSLF
ncbi:MAG: DUF4010 domain-containing protein [Candidatus Aenigmatarchaeota archaeon]